jgi:hypothetical protein
MEDMHTINMKIEGDIEFQKWLSVKQFLKIFPVWEF